MDKMLFEINGEEQNTGAKVSVKVLETEEGYAIVSFEEDRDPQTMVSVFKDNEFFSKKTKWDVIQILIHGEMQMAGMITPSEELDIGVRL